MMALMDIPYSSYDEWINAANKKKTDREQARRAYEYETYYQPKVEEYSALGQQAAGNVLEREMAKLRMRIGYNQYAGAGTGGWWNLARGGMETAGMQKGMELADQWKQFELGQQLNYMNREDQQAYEIQMQQLRYQQQMELNKQVAELNDASWWQNFGAIVGIASAFLPGIGQALGLPTNSLTDVFRAIGYQF